DVSVGADGQLQFASLASRVRGSLDNGGVVELGRAIGGAQRTSSSVHGNYRHRDDAVLQLSLGQSLDVIGTASIEGGTLHILGVQQDYTAERREWVVAAMGGLTGRFDSLNWSDSLFL